MCLTFKPSTCIKINLIVSVGPQRCIPKQQNDILFVLKRCILKQKHDLK